MRSHQTRRSFFLAAAVVLAGTPALADHGPVVVVPSRPDVPVIMDGVDVSGAIVYGDWGLYRPGHGYKKVIEPWPYYQAVNPPPPGYFPWTGRRPAYGRKEIEPPPNRALPRPAESYHREWSAGSSSAPATEYPPYDPPPVIVAPRFRR